MGGNSCISKISASVLRDALGGKAGSNSEGKTYDFHDVTIVFTGLTVTLKFHCCMIFLESMCTSREVHMFIFWSSPVSKCKTYTLFNKCKSSRFLFSRTGQLVSTAKYKLVKIHTLYAHLVTVSTSCVIAHHSPAGRTCCRI